MFIIIDEIFYIKSKLIMLNGIDQTYSDKQQVWVSHTSSFVVKGSELSLKHGNLGLLSGFIFRLWLFVHGSELLLQQCNLFISLIILDVDNLFNNLWWRWWCWSWSWWWLNVWGKTSNDVFKQSAHCKSYFLFFRNKNYKNEIVININRHLSIS